MSHYLLIYDLADDYLSRRGEFRGVHLKMAWDARAKGDLVLGGALGEPVDRAILMFKGESPKVAEDFAKDERQPLPPVATRFGWLQPFEGCAEFHEFGLAPPPWRSW